MKIFSREHLYDCAYFLLPLIYFFSLPVWASDLSIWTALGVQSLKLKTLVTVDPFSFLPTAPMVYPAWGMSLAYAGLFLAGGQWGMGLLSLFHKLILVLILLFIKKRTLDLMPDRWNLKNTLFIIVFFFGGSYFFVDRPALVAVLFLILSFETIERHRELKGRQLLGLFLLTIVWINTHASAFLIVGMLGWRVFASWGHQKLRGSALVDYPSFFIALALCVLALFFNPFGAEIFPYTYQTAQLSSVRMFDEWLSPLRFLDPIHSSLYLGWMSYLFFEVYKDIKNKTDRLWTSSYWPLSLLGFLAIRDIIWTFFLIPFFFLKGEQKKAEPASHQSLNAVILFSMVAMLLCLNPFKRPNFVSKLNPARYDLSEVIPKKEIELLAQSESKGRVFNDLYTGGLIALYLPNKIFVDARNIIFTHEALEHLGSIISLQSNWQALMDNYGFEFIFIKKTSDTKAFESAILRSKTWAVLSSRENYFLAKKRR